MRWLVQHEISEGKWMILTPHGLHADKFTTDVLFNRAALRELAKRIPDSLQKKYRVGVYRPSRIRDSPMSQQVRRLEANVKRDRRAARRRMLNARLDAGPPDGDVADDHPRGGDAHDPSRDSGIAASARTHAET